MKDEQIMNGAYLSSPWDFEFFDDFLGDLILISLFIDPKMASSQNFYNSWQES